MEAAAPQIINGSMTSLIVMENENYTIQCRSSNTRPAAVMSWKLGTSVISDISFGEHSTANNLVYVVSIFLFTPRRQHNGSQLICESHIHGQRHSTITRKTIIVWCKYKRFRS